MRRRDRAVSEPMCIQWAILFSKLPCDVIESACSIFTHFKCVSQMFKKRNSISRTLVKTCTNAIVALWGSKNQALVTRRCCCCWRFNRKWKLCFPNLGEKTQTDTAFTGMDSAHVKLSWTYLPSARYVHNDYRKKLAPLNFESQMFLKYNSSFLDVNTVNEILRKWIRFLKPSSTIIYFHAKIYYNTIFYTLGYNRLN